LIGSILPLLGLELAVMDHSTLSRRIETLEVVRPGAGSESVDMPAGSNGLRLCCPGGGLKARSKASSGAGRYSIATAADNDHIVA